VLGDQRGRDHTRPEKDTLSGILRMIAGRIRMKIDPKDFQVREGDEVDLKNWPTMVDPA
jgi:hypothetical protein